MVFHRVVIAFLAAGLIFAGAEAIGLAWAAQLFASEGSAAVERAVSMEPGNADYRARLAELEELAGEDPRPTLERAIALRPDDSELLIRLGLLEEAEGRTERAEELLLNAAVASRKYRPRWTLANYYFRQGDETQFWRWAREALAMSYGDRTPLFRLCWAMAPDPVTISSEAMPDRRDVRLAWTEFLAGERRFPEVAALAGELAQGASEAELNALFRITDVLLREGDYRGALGVWNPLCARGLVPAATIDPANGDVVTNGDFATPAPSRGFGWRIPRIEGVFVTQSPGRWNVALSGSQPERREVLSQYVALEPGGRYRFSSRYRCRSTGPASDVASSGLRWRLRVPGGDVLAESDELTFDGEEEADFELEVPGEVTGALLALYHERASGWVRMEGSVELEQVRLEPQ